MGGRRRPRRRAVQHRADDRPARRRGAFLGRLSTDAARRTICAPRLSATAWTCASPAPPTTHDDGPRDLDAPGTRDTRFTSPGRRPRTWTRRSSGPRSRPRRPSSHRDPRAGDGARGHGARDAGVADPGPDTLLVVDPNCRPAAITDRDAYVARIRAILAPRPTSSRSASDDLAYLVAGRAATIDAACALLGGARVVLLTDGGGGPRDHPRLRARRSPVPSMPVVDTIGAGDAFGGGFVARWVERGLRSRGPGGSRTPSRTPRATAIAVAGITCGRAGADPPTRAEVRLAGGSDRRGRLAFAA